MTKYPGSFILNEMGTRKELAVAYGVSERTIYRWLNKARAETGEKKPKPRRPRQSTLENFKGTRKELAKKYGVSERTVYRWLNKAKQQGADIPSRQKKKIAKDMGLPEEIITPDMLPEEIYTPEQLPEEITFDESEEAGQEAGQEAGPEDSKEENLNQTLIDLLFENDMISADSPFRSMDPNERLEYISAYLDYQQENNPSAFYDKETHDFNFSPDFVSTINIWGDTFETWLSNVRDLEAFGDVWFD